jgi:outer membrane protein assembly factor BamB
MPRRGSVRGMKFLPVSLVALGLCAGSLNAENWPTWRGPRLDGTSTEKNVPAKWSASENIAWRTELPGGGHASPIVWTDRVFTIAADLDTGERMLLCLDRKDGKLLWKQTVLTSPPERKHRENSHASSTPATDGRRVFCTFLDGTEVVVAAYDFAGQMLWQKRPGTFHSVHGFCSTPVLFDGKVILNCDQDAQGYLVALSAEDGAEKWRTERPNNTRSYCTPLIRKVGARTEMVLSGSKCVTGYDPGTGKLRWIIDGPTEQFVASLAYNERANVYFMTAGFPQHHILAIRPGGEGNVTKSHIAWRTTEGAAYVPSPIAEGDYCLVVSDLGFAHCYEAKTGDLAWKERFGRHHASLVSANGLVYFLNDDGVCHIVRPGPKFDLVAKNELGEETYASPAISGGALFIRGEKSLFCIGKP